MADVRSIPSIDRLRQRDAVRALEAQFGSAAALDALRAAAAECRAGLAAGAEVVDPDVGADIERRAAELLDRGFQPSLQPVINATGVVIHTNLGRAPLAEPALARVQDVARGYAALEFDVARGERGRRDVHAEALLRRLTGAEAAVVVNNNAAATLLILAAVAAGREVIVSRGELVEIGGGFRVPDVMAQSGATLREVGTTNKTRAADYAAAITDRTALLLRVHPSNFRIEGFVERPALSDLVAVGRKFKVPVAEDLGSGHLGRAAGAARVPGADEPAVEDSVHAGVDLCCFSGDKLLGGPQAGIIVGRRELVDGVRRHPLMRALRVDKLTYAALEATLIEYAAGRAASTVPVQQMLTASAEDIRGRARRLVDRLASSRRAYDVDLVDGTSAVGGGSAPGVELPTCLVALRAADRSAETLSAALRAAAPPVVARIERDRVLLDLRTVLPHQDAALIEILERL